MRSWTDHYGIGIIPCCCLYPRQAAAADSHILASGIPVLSYFGGTFEQHDVVMRPIPPPRLEIAVGFVYTEGAGYVEEAVFGVGGERGGEEHEAAEVASQGLVR